jgi:hypothetical protein
MHPIMPKPDRKQRHEAKRKAKRLALRRRESISPVKRLADAPGDVECWISENFDEMRQMQLFVYKQAAGLSGMAAFLVDRGVVGLKDTWVRMNLERNEVLDAVNAGSGRGIRMRRGTVDEVRCWIAGAARWAHDNGMRLPKDWLKPASLLGGVGDWLSADVSRFEMEFVGHPEDLQQRLIGQPLESYLRRKDIRFIFSADAPWMDQRTGRYQDRLGSFGVGDEELDEEQLQSMFDEIPPEMKEWAEQVRQRAETLAIETAQWVSARGQAPSPLLRDAWHAIALSGMATRAALTEDSGAGEFARLGNKFLGELLDTADEDRREPLDLAMKQMKEHIEADAEVMSRLFPPLPDGDKPATGERAGAESTPNG